ncbi:hypothetical protein [Arthrobacter sp. Y81]|uniref:hypothetical protein n=1 Tax=Arthrobacter sp. Y81 TaxID=2058897 RepID=UPI0015E320BC|nr:hypothetical protein [Arthrobacter sp. Y81]
MPTYVTFWLLLVVELAVFVASLFLPRHTVGDTPEQWRPRAVVVPIEVRGIFTAASVAVLASYALGTIMLSVGAQIARDLVRSDNALVPGAVISVSFIIIGMVAIAAGRMPSRQAIAVGSVASTVSLAILLLSATLHSLPLFLLAAAALGVGYSLLFLGGLSLINAHAPVHQRAATLSAMYLIAYIVQAGTALSLGATATTAGLEAALTYAAPVIALLAVTATVLAFTIGRPGSSPATSESNLKKVEKVRSE